MSTHHPRHSLGEPCVSGDWACTHGDLETLGDVASRLAAYVDEPLRCELVALREICRCDPDRAVAAWIRLKQRVLYPLVGRPIGWRATCCNQFRILQGDDHG